MEQLPKIVQQRLRVSAWPETHPDANLLGAFAEKSLGEVERQQVLAHLALCANCRSLVLLTLPQPPAAAGIESGRAGFPWLSWPVLRWAAAAGCVITVGAAVTLRYTGHKSLATFSAARPEAAPVAEYKVAPQTPPAVVEGDKLALKVEPKIALDQRDQATRARSKAPAPPPSSNRVAATPSREVGAATAKVAGEVAQSNSPLPGTSMQQVMVTGAAPAVSAAKTDAELQKEARADANELKNTVPSVSESVEVQAEAPVISTQATELAPGKAKDAKRELKKAGPAGVAGATVAGGPMAPGPVVLQGRQYDMLALAPTSSARWSLSAGGALLRSLDAGKSWQAVPVAEHVVFRAVSATGPDVWTGGVGGALYHSTDGGQHWVQLKPSVDGSALSDDIIGIEFSDANHGKIEASKHEVWITNDAGQSWQKR